MAAGFAAGVTEALVVVTPFEVVKIRLQQQKGLTKELMKYKVRPGPGPRVQAPNCPGAEPWATRHGTCAKPTDISWHSHTGEHSAAHVGRTRHAPSHA